MTRILLSLWVLAVPVAALCDSVVPTKTIRANATIGVADVTVKPTKNGNAFSRVDDVIGQEARTTLYAGRPILFDDIGPPALIARNEIVQLKYVSHGLTITTEGRSLQRGGIGDRIRIMNLESRATLFGQIEADGTVRITK
jgi:flagella basal body P-ring formation protein FlgA